MEFIVNSKEISHKAEISRLINWAERCYLCTSFFDKKGLDIILLGLKKGIKDRQLKVHIFSNGEKEYTKPFVINSLQRQPAIDFRVIKEKQFRLHSKVYLFEKGEHYKLMVGSANLTGNGLTKNEEFSCKTEGKCGSEEHRKVTEYFEHLRQFNHLFSK